MTTSTRLTPDVARALGGPDWLRARRTAAAEAFLAAELPTPDEEVWRYSRIGDLDLDAYEVTADPPGTTIPEGLHDALAAIPNRSASLYVANGRIQAVEVNEAWAAKGLVVGGLAETGNGKGDAAAALGSVATEPPDVFTTMNDAFGVEPVVVRVPAGLALDGPVVVVHFTDAEGLATFPRLVVQAGADSQATVLDVHVSSSAARLFSAPVVELDVGPAARLGYLNLQDLGLGAWQIGSQVSRVDASATLVSAAAALGGDYTRQRTDCRMVGRGASSQLLAFYFGEGDQHLDFRTFQDHAAPDTTSELLFKGAVGGRSRSVYTGLIRVRPNASGTNAFQTNRNIKLSEHAWAESVPNLKIENNDVRCSHASAVGPVDADQRFYLESRGVPPGRAEQLVVTGFFDEILARLPVPGAVPTLRARIAEKFVRRHE